MKFETIKTNAKQLFAGAMNQWPTQALTSGLTFDALLPFVLATKGEREEMRDFAEAFQAKPGDWLGNAAKSQETTRLDVAWNQTVLRAREAGLKLIDNWDVRRVEKLIELFPGCVPANYRDKPLDCYMANNEDSDWMVEVVRQREVHEAPRG